MPKLDFLIERLRHPNIFIRGEAIDALVKMGPAAVDGLIPALGFPEKCARAAAAYALFRIRDKQGTKALINRLNIEPDKDVQIEIAYLLGQIRSLSAVDVAVKFFSSRFQTKDWKERREMVYRLAEIDHQYSGPALSHALDDPNEEVQETARRGIITLPRQHKIEDMPLPTFRDPLSGEIDELLDALNTTNDYFEKLVIIRKLGEIGDLRTASALEQITRNMQEPFSLWGLQDGRLLIDLCNWELQKIQWRFHQKSMENDQ